MFQIKPNQLPKRRTEPKRLHTEPNRTVHKIKATPAEPDRTEPEYWCAPVTVLTAGMPMLSMERRKLLRMYTNENYEKDENYENNENDKNY